MQHYLGMYDVSCPKLRSAIFKILSAYGIHQQKSVFVCQLNQDTKRQLLQQLILVSSLYQKRIVLLKIYPNHPDTVLFGAAKRMPASNCLYIG